MTRRRIFSVRPLRPQSYCLRKRLRLAVRLAGLALGLAVLAGCQTTDGGKTLGGMLGSEYNLLYSPADHVRELLQQDKVAEASAVYTAQAAFFTEAGAKYDALLTELRRRAEAGAEAAAQPTLDRLSAIQVPGPAEAWTEVKAALEAADAVREKARGQTILQRGTRAAVLDALDTGIDGIRERLRAKAGTALIAYGLLRDPPFAETYPLAMDDAAMLAAAGPALDQAVGALAPAELLALHERYGEALPAATADGLAVRYVETATEAGVARGQSWLQARIGALRAADAAGLEIPGKLAARVQAVDISSPTLRRARQFDFPVALKAGIPVKRQAAALDDALAPEAAEATDAVVLIEVSAARATRRIDRYHPVPSERQIGTRTVANPAYSAAQNAVTQAQTAVQSAQMQKLEVNSTSCTGLICAAIQLAAMMSAQKALDEKNAALQQAMSSLQDTPVMIDEPVYQSYQFRRAAVAAHKAATVDYYVVDRRSGRIFKDSFEAKEHRDFEVPYEMSEQDRHRQRHLDELDSEKDVVEFEKQAMTVEVGDLLEQFFAHRKTAKPLPSLVALRRAIVADRNIALAHFQADRVKPTERGEYARLADSVVVVTNTANGGLGSGFYVNDDLLLTNHHVVEDADFVELRLHDGRESFGKVVASDVRRDLALVRAEARGSPLGFFTGTEVPVGATVIAIGHPRRFGFSLSRGIISAVRKMRPLKVGGRKVWFVQTDAAINPGNSGGPLFLDGLVIGVNDWKSAVDGDSGLNFAILYKEAVDFLKEQGVPVRTGKPAPRTAEKDQ